MNEMHVDEIAAAALEALLAQEPRNFTLVDVRESHELDRGILPGAVHIPMSQFQGRVGELDRRTPVIAYCEHGVRSFHVAAFLTSHGYIAKSLQGGFAVWHGPTAPHK